MFAIPTHVSIIGEMAYCARGTQFLARKLPTSRIDAAENSFGASIKDIIALSR
jgi:hypothetical protein